MVLLDASTGLRRGELMALRWQDIDFEKLIAHVTRSIYRNVILSTIIASTIEIEEKEVWE